MDVFQGCAPRTAIAEHYTGKGLERLKRIYEKADQKFLERANALAEEASCLLYKYLNRLFKSISLNL